MFLRTGLLGEGEGGGCIVTDVQKSGLDSLLCLCLPLGQVRPLLASGPGFPLLWGPHPADALGVGATRVDHPGVQNMQCTLVLCYAEQPSWKDEGQLCIP